MIHCSDPEHYSVATTPTLGTVTEELSFVCAAMIRVSSSFDDGDACAGPETQAAGGATDPEASA